MTNCENLFAISKAWKTTEMYEWYLKINQKKTKINPLEGWQLMDSSSPRGKLNVNNYVNPWGPEKRSLKPH